jgi:putative Holliday junction resolvase
MMLDQALSVPASQQSFLAFDFGLKRTGVAVGNRMLKQATPQATVVAEGDARFA